MDPTPLIVDEQMPIEQLSDILVDDETKYIFDGFIVTRDGRYVGVGTGYTLIRHLTDRKQAELFHLAHHDPLTSLPNRQLFTDRLNQALTRAERHRLLVSVLFIDVDRFKSVNDSLGHAVGDLLLQRIGARLRAVVRADDTVARLSGDEFAIVLSDIRTAADAERVADKLVHALQEPHLLEQHEVNVSCSIGVAVFPVDALRHDELLRAADDAVYHAKQFRNTWQRYSSDMRRTGPDTRLAFSAVRRVLEEGRLEVYYQPQIRMRDRAVSGFEALVRWRDDDGMLLPTAELIRLAEDAGLIAEITDHVLGAAMQQMLEWQKLPGMERLQLAVNVSGVEMRGDTLLRTLQRHLDGTGFPPALLELEITESTVMHSAPSTMSMLEELRRLGVRLSVDDFGTGYSSLSRLQRLPVDALKMDQSFIHEISDSGALVRGIVMMAHALNLVVVAEGVETARQLEFLEQSGCDYLQGYLFSRPLPAGQVPVYLHNATGQPPGSDAEES